MKNIKIALTGGPCGGKTESIHEFSEKLSKQYSVITNEEVASGLLNLGYLDEISMSTYDFQNLLFRIQFINEYNAENSCDILLCDRGLLDPMAYLSGTDYEKILNQNEVELNKILGTYNFALYFRTIAYEYPNLFKQLRIYESPLSARQRDIQALKIWRNILLDIKYSNEEGFDSKKNIIYAEMIKKLDNIFETESYTLSDYYSTTTLIQMKNGIDEILYSNNISADVKRKTLGLIK